MNCRKASEMILNGESGAELEQHMSRCPECAELARNCREFRLEPSVRTEVPPALDRAVLEYAAARAGQHKTRGTIRFPRASFWIPAAAALLIAGTIFHMAIPGDPGVPAKRAAAAVPVSAPEGESAARFATLENAAALDTELLSLSLELDSAEPELFSVASGFSGSFYSSGSYYDF